ncbi:uncharacterized protein LOC124274991 isoform X2 [Haliotis rubra]|uniref:uncharacterized protein LOC124274991 isoform X2 n=1 Tax=Haliotis rubra TaxID=36100 RepID=UPI001EE51DC9|nr:uncharacterized protein LOC124274991 isoform X2 [Haliotis rubra]XP_046566363.1 uncharacterized protein LOC124274991 isoform X2 [Haliotis rubra]
MCQITPNPVLVKFIMVTKVQMTFLVFQEQDDNDCDNDNDADFDNEDGGGSPGFSQSLALFKTERNIITAGAQAYSSLASKAGAMFISPEMESVQVFGCYPGGIPDNNKIPCPICGKTFSGMGPLMDHKAAVHDNVSYVCVCGKKYKYRPGLVRHHRSCAYKNGLGES